MTRTAILVDGAYFLMRYRHTYGHDRGARRTVRDLVAMCHEHLEERGDLYRIFFYDCPPLGKRIHNPVSGKALDLSRTDIYRFRVELHRQLLRQRKLALRLGRLADRTADWVLTSDATRSILRRRLAPGELEEKHVTYRVHQKGVDMRIGLDIASLAFKRLVDRIVLVAGDADFVPAAKFARREGIDVVLDPMWQVIGEDLFEHIDGLASLCPKPSRGPVSRAAREERAR